MKLINAYVTHWVVCCRLLLGGLLCVCTTALYAQSPPLTDTIVDPKIATVLLYPQVGSVAAGGRPGSSAQTLNVPLVRFDDQAQSPLQLEFDDLTANYRNFRAKIIHCNANWVHSVLNDIEYTYEYNDVPITEYQVSVGTKIPYYHYRYSLPRLKLPGNYVLVVYNEQNRNQVLFTRRFRVYANLLSVDAAVRFSTDVSRQFNDQQVDLTIGYRAYQSQVTSPQDDFKVVIRQNYRDDRTVTGLRPTNVRSFDQVLEYRAIDL
ncbi:MAG TPA: type IX secretion system plug protein domain-containing protein, partial [Fibrella sp.]